MHLFVLWLGKLWQVKDQPGDAEHHVGSRLGARCRGTSGDAFGMRVSPGLDSYPAGARAMSAATSDGDNGQGIADVCTKAGHCARHHIFGGKA